MVTCGNAWNSQKMSFQQSIQSIFVFLVYSEINDVDVCYCYVCMSVFIIQVQTYNNVVFVVQQLLVLLLTLKRCSTGNTNIVQCENVY